MNRKKNKSKADKMHLSAKQASVSLILASEYRKIVVILHRELQQTVLRTERIKTPYSFSGRAAVLNP